MKKIAVAIQKGGVGKTATSVHLAFDFFENKKLRVAFIDLDPQGNASLTLRNYVSKLSSIDLFSNVDIDSHFSSLNKAEPTLKLISSSKKLVDLANKDINEAAKVFSSNLDRFNEYFDVVLIDTAPSLNNAMVAALYTADFVLSPINLDVYSIQGIQMMSATISSIKKANNKKLVFLGMLPSKVDSRNSSHKKHLSQLREKYPSLITPVHMGYRQRVEDALADGVPVWKIKKTSAREAGKEFLRIADFVFDRALSGKGDRK